jgi:hypothetical protein
MISLLKYKELLGDKAQDFTDEEIERIYDAQYQFAKLAFDKWAKEKGLVKTKSLYRN